MKYIILFLFLTFLVYGEEDMSNDNYERYYNEFIQPKLEEYFNYNFLFMQKIKVEFWDKYNHKHRILNLNTYYYFDKTECKDYLGIQYLGGIWFFRKLDYYSMLYHNNEYDFQAWYFHMDGNSKPGCKSFSMWHNSFKFEKSGKNIIVFEPKGDGIIDLTCEWLFSFRVLDNFVKE